MKKFAFHINQFYNIFSGMSGNPDKKDFDSYLDDKLRRSMQSHSSADFTSVLIGKIELEKSFEKEDGKTRRLAGFVTVGFALVLAVTALMFGFAISNSESGSESGLFNGAMEKFSGAVESVSMFITDNLGFALNAKTGIILMLVMGCVFLFSFADRIMFRKSLK